MTRNETNRAESTTAHSSFIHPEEKEENQKMKRNTVFDQQLYQMMMMMPSPFTENECLIVKKISFLNFDVLHVAMFDLLLFLKEKSSSFLSLSLMLKWSIELNFCHFINWNHQQWMNDLKLKNFKWNQM